MSTFKHGLFTMTATAACVAVLAVTTQSLAANAKAKVVDGWGNEVEVQGYNDEKLPGGKWYVHDPKRPQPKAVEPGPSPTLGAKPPKGAVMLTWKNKKWKFNSDGSFTATKRCGSQVSNEKFGSCQLHVEFATPKEVKGNGQGRGNSGVIIMGKYEIQVLDNWKNATYPDGQCAAIYGQKPPDVNACRKPGEWQTYDITFIAPKFEGKKLVRPGSVTVRHNNVLVHNKVVLLGAVSHRRMAKWQPHPDKLPLTLQDHGNPVSYRNVWYAPIED